jgi:hypothetical protein
MKKISRFVVSFCLGFTFAGMAAAQESQGGGAVPKILQISREWLKPGKSGAAHEKAESAFVQAMSRAKFPTHYLAMTSLSGKSRALFMTRYASYEAWEKDNNTIEKNATLSAALEHAYVADGELLDSVDQGVFEYNQEMSLRPRADLSHMRYMEISLYHVKPGHIGEWRELVKMVKAANEKAIPDAHWGMFEQRYGGEGGTYLVLHARASLAELDKGDMESKQFADAMGEEGMKKFAELYGSAVDLSQHQLFAFSPKMSYIYDDWAKSDPDFWKTGD